MRITDWPKEDRPREKLLAMGAKHLTDAELVAIFLSTGTHDKTALDIAKELLAKYGNLKTMLQAPLPHTTHGIGPVKYARLKAAIELGCRYNQEIVAIGETLNDTERVISFLASRLKNQPQEIFACLFLDQHCRLLGYEALFHGTIHETTIYPREIVRRCLYYNAAKLILAHNHPSGIATPSQADKELTLLVKKAMALIDVVVLDHIIIGNDIHHSMASYGLL